MLAFAVTSLDSATKTLVNDTARLIEEDSSGKGVKRISREKILNTVTYSTMGILGVLNVILLITGFPKVFTILFCLIFVPFFIRAIVYTFKFAAGKADYSGSGTVTEEEYAIIKEQTKDFLYEADR